MTMMEGGKRDMRREICGKAFLVHDQCELLKKIDPIIGR
jgi:hypothetical protein